MQKNKINVVKAVCNSIVKKLAVLSLTAAVSCGGVVVNAQQGDDREEKLKLLVILHNESSLLWTHVQRNNDLSIEKEIEAGRLLRENRGEESADALRAAQQLYDEKCRLRIIHDEVKSRLNCLQQELFPEQFSQELQPQQPQQNQQPRYVGGMFSPFNWGFFGGGSK